MRFQLSHRRYRLPFLKPVRTAHGLWTEREGVIVQLTNEAGHIGYGEAAPIPWFGTGTADEVVEVLLGLGEWVGAAELAGLPAHVPTLQSAIQSALHPPPPGVHAHLQVAALLPAGKPALAVLREQLESGFRIFKWKVGVGDAADERGLLDELLAHLPSGARLRLDANGAWSRRQADAWLTHTADRPIEFIEQPVAATDDNTDWLLGLAHEYPTPLALDESVVSQAEIEHWLEIGWPGLYVVKPSLLANPPAVLARLSRSNAEVVFSSALETAVGAQAALRLAFAWSGKPRALGFGVWPLFGNHVCNGPVAAPFIRSADVERLAASAVWQALG